MAKKAYIIGIGPAGLASALALLSSGYSVVMIDHRSEKDLFDRKQGIILQSDTIAEFFLISGLGNKGYFLEFDDFFRCKLIHPTDELSLDLTDEDKLDLKFFELIEKERSIITIGALQRYQYNKLKFIYKKGGYFIHEHDENNSETTLMMIDKAVQKLTMHMNDAQIVSVDATKQELVLNINGVNESHSFDLLVDASGKTSKSFTKLWNMQNPEFAIKYEQVANPKHTAFGVLYASITNPSLSMIRTPLLSPHGEISSFIPFDKMTQLRDLGWTQEQPPLIYFKYSKELGTVYLTGEIPERLLDSNSELEVKRWFDLVMQLIFNNSDFKTHNVSLASVFKLNIEIADKYALILPNGGVYCLVGDALMSSNLLLGSGVKNAFADANELYEMIQTQFAFSENYRNERLMKYNKHWGIFTDLIQSKLDILKIQDKMKGLDHKLEDLREEDDQLDLKLKDIQKESERREMAP